MLERVPERFGCDARNLHLRRRLQTFDALCAQEGFDPRVVGDLGALRACLASLLCALPGMALREPVPALQLKPYDDDAIFGPRRPFGPLRPRWNPVLPPLPTRPWMPFYERS